MEDSDVWLGGPRSATSPGVESDLGCAQTKSARRSAGHAVRDLDISPEGGCVYPQRQQAMLELDLSGRLRPDAGASSYPGEELVGVARGSDGIEGNCNLRSDDDTVYDEMLDLLPIAYNARLLSFDESSSSSSSFRRPAWTSASWADSLGFDATPLADDPFPAAATKLRSERVKGDGGGVAVVKDGSGQVRSEASVRRTTKVMSSVLKMIRSLDLLEEDEGQVPEEEEQQEGVVEGANSSSNDGAIHGFGVEGLDQLIGKVEAWSANHGQLIEAAYRRGVQSSEMRLKRLSQQLMNFKHRLFEVSRDRQVITTYVRRHEQSWSCRHDRLRMEVLRLQKLVHDLQKSPDQLEESRQMYEGEGGGGGGGGAGSGTGGEAEGGGRTGGRGGGGGGTTPQGKTDETMDKLLSVIVEHQSRINELKLTVFAQQQHILSLEEILREGNCPSLIDEDNNIQLKHRPHEENNVATPDAKSRSSKSNPITKESTRHDALEQIASGETATATKPTPSLPSPSSPETALGHFVSSKMSDVLLCDEGDYRLCQTNQPEVATDSTLTNIRCLCHKHGVACSSSAQVQLVGQLPYLMDSPLDTEVAGVLARPKARPFSLADLPYVRHSIATQRLAPEQTSGDLDFLL